MSCASVFTGVGTKVYINDFASGAPTTPSEWPTISGWVEVGEVSGIGEYGHEATLTQFKSLSGTICKAKGAVNYGSAQLTVALVPENPGQQLLRAAVSSKNSIGFKIAYADATLSLDVPSVDYFFGLVMSFKKNPGSDPDGIVTATMQIEINSEIYEVVRHAGA